MRDYASKIGLDPRTFYRLIATRRNGSAGRGRPRRQLPSHSAATPQATLSRELQEIITLALQRVARPCQLSEVQAEVIRLSEERNVAPPARGTVRSRFRDVSNAPTPDRGGSSWILDSCTLAVDLEEPAGGIAPAVLVALVDSRARQVALHDLFCGHPGLMEMDKLFRDSNRDDPRSSIPDSIIASWAFKHQAGALAKLLRQRGIVLSTTSPSCRGAANPMITGEAIRSVVGSMLGKIPIRTRTARGTQADPIVSLDVARAVVAASIERINAGSA